METLYFYLFGWCQNDVEMMFSLFMFMFIICQFFNFFSDLIKDSKGMK